MSRLFLALPVPPEAAARLSALLPRLPGRPVALANLHLTVRFLGEIDEVASDRLTAALDEAPLGGELEVALGEMGAFPRPARASVLWLAIVKGTERLTKLNGLVEEACEEAGLEPVDRPYAPHLTISRIRPAIDVRPVIASYRFETVKWTAPELVLFQSHLGRGGAIYEPVERFPL